MYLILEVANTHGGDFNYINQLIDEFSEIKGPSIGIKFQPFKYDKISVEDYDWYEVYQKLFFNLKQWKEIFSKVDKTQDIWLDIFDEYGVQVLSENIVGVHGIKLQSSVLENQKLISQLYKLDFSNKNIILNVAGRKIEDIRLIIDEYQQKFSPKNLLIEIGFQSYPTMIKDSGISKITTIKSSFANKIVFADHIDGENPDAVELPFIANLLGAEIIEKHIMHSQLETKYDFHSSIKINGVKKLIAKVKQYDDLLGESFINDRELDYLSKTIQIPVLNSSKKRGEFVSFKDFNYKRTNQKGLDFNELKELFIKEGKVKLSVNKEENQVLLANDIEKPKIACIVAARLKSSRLKKKAILPIGSLPSIQLCIKNCLKFKGVDYTVLATSNLEEDALLLNHTYHKDVIFHQGDPVNVIDRYIGVIDQLGIDTFIRVTGDMPFVSNQICQILLKEHFKSNADYTVAKHAAVGTNLEIINTKALKKVIEYFPKAEYSEYMTWYFQNNPDHFNLNFVELPKDLERDYRLTLDYPEDLKMFNLIQNYFETNNLEFSIDQLFKLLDSNGAIAEINSHLNLTYKTDKNLISTLNSKTKIKKQ